MTDRLFAERSARQRTAPATNDHGYADMSESVRLRGAGDRDGGKAMIIKATMPNGEEREISYSDTKVVGNGSFGVVFKAQLNETNDIVAIKKVLQDRRFKNRELQIMRQLSHPNVVRMLYFFYSSSERQSKDVYLHLVLEFVPETIYRVTRQYTRVGQFMPMIYVRLYTYQMFKALAYIHGRGICHRDIKPQNLLVDHATGVLKLCDFGSAKVLVKGEPNVSYICSRYYRAPELIFGASDYTTAIDVWAAGCVMAELMVGQPIFPGDSGVDQLVQIIKVLGTPTREEILAMNPDYTEFKFPKIKPHEWSAVFGHSHIPSSAIQLIGRTLAYMPNTRVTALEGCAVPLFDELRDPNTVLPDGKQLPPDLFTFSRAELDSNPGLAERLIPPHARA